MSTLLSNIIDRSYDTYLKKQEVTKELSSVLKETATEYEVEPDVLRLVKDVKHYKGNGWINDNPLELDKEEKHKDKLSPTFKKLLTVCQALGTVNKLDLLDEYLKALSENGINITFDTDKLCTVNNNYEPIYESICEMDNLQTQICDYQTQIKDKDSLDAEEQNFGPAKEYTKLISFYAKAKKDKSKVDDTYQEISKEILLKQKSYDDIYNDRLDTYNTEK